MKTKFYVLAALLMAGMVNIMADDDVNKIKQVYPTPPEEWVEKSLDGWDSDTKGLFISKDQFSDIEVGNAIKLYLYNPGDDAKVYIGGFEPTYHYPGTDFRTGNGQPKLYVTEAMKAALQAGDFRLYGHGVKINRVEIWRGKHDVPGAIKFGKTIWTGYFWMDSWTTLEMFKEAFNDIDLSKYRAIRFYHEAGRTDFVMNIIQAWGNPVVKIADQDDMTKTNEYFELPLDETMRERFTTFIKSGEETLKIQCNKESGEAFNFTDVVLLPISPDDCSNCFYVY